MKTLDAINGYRSHDPMSSEKRPHSLSIFVHVDEDEVDRLALELLSEFRDEV